MNSAVKNVNLHKKKSILFNNIIPFVCVNALTKEACFADAATESTGAL